MKQSFKNYIKDNSNIPNLLTLFRVILIPVYWIVFFNLGEDKKPALIIFAIASFSDFLDGYLARKYNRITSFGKLMDPLADKLMVLSVMLSQYFNGIIPCLPITIILIKELIMIFGAAYLYKKNIVVYSSPIGKIGMGVFVLALFTTFFHENIVYKNIYIDICLIWISVIIAIIALIYYTIKAKQRLLGTFK